MASQTHPSILSHSETQAAEDQLRKIREVAHRRSEVQTQEALILEAVARAVVGNAAGVADRQTQEVDGACGEAEERRRIPVVVR